MTSAERGTWRRVVLVLLGVVVLAVSAAAGLLGGRALREAQEPLPALVADATAAPDVAAALATPSTGSGGSTGSATSTASPGTAPGSAEVGAALARPLSDPRLGARTLAQVVDLATGTTLLGRDADVDAAPASTAKIVTAAAALTVYDGEDRVTTTVVAGPGAGEITLVGAGDPTLSAAAPGTATPYADAARISDLAAAVATSLAATGGVAGITAVDVDGSAFSGPTTADGWGAEDAPSEYGAPVTAAMVDGGRDTPDAIGRSADPDLAAGQALAEALGVPDVPVRRLTDEVTEAGTEAGTASPTVLGSVQSAPIGEIVGQMLKESDNVLAENLARLVAIEQGERASFTGAARAVREAVPEAGDGLVDGSGLSVDDRMSPAELTAVLRRVATTDRLHEIVTMLPVAGWDGTLRERYVDDATDGAGRVRAKTGTLTGVSCLAGVAVTGSGRLLGFAFLADGVTPTYGGTLDAEAALDDVAAALAAIP